MKERIWITLLAAGPMLLIPVMVILTSFIVINAEKEVLESSLSRMEQDHIERMKSSVQSKVDSIVDLAAYRKSVIKAGLHERIQQRVKDAHQIANALYQRYSSVKSEEEVKLLIIEALRPLVWNDDESFIWAIDFEGVFQLAPEYLKHLEGESIIDFKDATGREVIKEEIALTRLGGEGFLWDTFTRPNTGTDEQFEQLAFVKSLGFYDWYIGSAEFLDIATKLSDSRLLIEINQLSAGGSNYFFIIGAQGRLLLNSARPEWEGLSYQDTDDVVLKKLYQKILNITQNAQNTSFITYQWLNPQKNKVELKLSYVKAVPGSEWIIGSGFYPEDIARELQPKIIAGVQQNQQKLQQLMKMAFWSVLVSFGIALLLTFGVYRLLCRYRSEVIEKNKALLDLNEGLEKKVSKRTQALAMMNDELEILARTDCLTGMDNRFSFMKIADGEVRRYKRFKDTFSVILLDVDDFKKINDQYGHDVGDSVLIELTKVMSNSLREVDTLCRFGGEEFIVMLPKTELEIACATANRLCEKIAEHPFKFVGQVTISIGVGCYQADVTIDELIKKVDVALYEAKNSGKNRVHCADE